MDSITILTNPEQKYWEELVKLVVTEERWTNSVRDYKVFQDAFGEHFTLLVAVDKDTQEFVGSVCVATYTKPEPLSAIGMYFVRKDRRGQGIGGYLFEKILELCAPRKFLYGVEKMMPRYRDRYGFGNIPSWHLITARVENRKVKPLNLNHDPTLIIKSPSLCGWDTISKYYQKFLPGLDGSAMIKAFLQDSGSHCAVAMTPEDRIVALVRVRETYGKELTIGPLLGNDTIAACSVLRHVLCHIENLRDYNDIVFNFPNTNEDVTHFLRQMTDGGEFKIGGVTYPQFTSEIFEVPTNYIYAVSENDVAII